LSPPFGINVLIARSIFNVPLRSTGLVPFIRGAIAGCESARCLTPRIASSENVTRLAAVRSRLMDQR
jgi:hypothetical protein